jgi:chemotaxis protein methyltransferase CheR
MGVVAGQMNKLITDEEFRKLTKYIKVNYGINLKEEKRTLVTGRLQSVLAENRFQNFSQYYDYIVSDKTGEAAATLVNKITTNHTYFMREAQHFFYFRDTVLPYLREEARDKDLRIWSAGCSSGEEPYTLAMLIDEYFGREKIWWDTKILATDISQKVLAKARRGVYSGEEVESLPASWRINYFRQQEDKRYLLVDRIKQEVIYRKFNLIQEVFPFKKKFHVIFCRNVMIYFDTPTKEALVEKLYRHTRRGGYLFVGHSESLNRAKTDYKYVRPAIYRKEW